MDLAECKKKIDRFLSKDNVQPLIVDVQNHKDWSDLMVHYNVGTNSVIKASDYCKKDEFPQIDRLFHDLETKDGTSFVTGLTSFLKLRGEQELRKVISEILSMTTAGHVVVITYQCHRYMDFKDPRLQPRIAVLDGEEQTTPEIYLSSPGLSLKGVQTITGIDSFAVLVESTSADKLLVFTSKEKADYPKALYRIIGLSKAYDALLQKDPKTSELSEAIGTDEQWKYALGLFEKKPDWIAVIDGEFGNHMTLEIHVQNYNRMAADRLWLYFVGLKLFGAKNNWCLNYASARSSGLRDLISNVYRGILNKNVKDADFWDCYESRKMLENLVRELKEGEINREKTIKMKQTLEKIENAINLEKKDIEKEAESIAEKSVEKNVEFEVGDKVKFGEKRTSGIIVKKEKKGFYQVQVGSMKISMDGRKLEKVFDGGKKENNVTVEFEKENTKFFSSLSSSDEKPVFELRILGMRYEQAVKALEKQLDLCCINNFKNFSIVHGKGEGILQKAVWDCLSKYPFVESYNFAAPEDGGSGKTYVTMR